MATNAAATTSTTISNLRTGSGTPPTDMTSGYDGLLKDVYLPGLTDTVFNDPSFLALIQRSTRQVDYEGQRIIRGFKTQRGGGVGPIAEGGDFVPNVSMKGQQGFEQIKYLNAYFSLTGPAIRAAQQGPGSFVDVVNDTFEDLIINTKNDLNRQVMGEQNGKLCQVNDSTPTGTTLTVSGDAFFDTQHIVDGMEVEFRDNVNGTATVRTSIDGTNDYVSISSHTRGSKKMTSGSYSSGGTITVGESITASVQDEDWVTRRNAYTSGSSSDCLEINGLQNLVTDGVDHSANTDGIDESTGANYTNTWNAAVTSNSFLASYIEDVGTNASGGLDEEYLLDLLMVMRYERQASPNILVVSPRAMLIYFANVKDDRRFNTMSAMEWVGGYTGLGIQLGDVKMMLTAVGAMPDRKMYMLNTADFAFATMTNDFEWLTKGGRILTQKEGSDAQFATAVNYLNLICNDPMRQMKGYGVVIDTIYYND